MKHGLVVFLFAFMLPVAWGQAPRPESSDATKEIQQSSQLESELAKAVSDQREAEALSLALQLLHTVPIQKAVFSASERTPEYDFRPQRRAALLALQTFDALDEYQRKIKAYYKEDTGNVVYDQLMAEVLGLHYPRAATPFLEAAHRAAPDDMTVLAELAARYEDEGRDKELYDLVDPVVAADQHVPGGLRVDLIKLYAKQNQLPRLARLNIDHLPPVTPKDDFFTASPLGVLDQFQFNFQALEAALKEARDTSDLIALERAKFWHTRPGFGDPLPYLQLLAEKGDHDAFGQGMAEVLFPADDSRRNENRLTTFSSEFSDYPEGPMMDLLRQAAIGGQVPRLKQAGQVYMKAFPEDLEAQGVYAFLLIAAHDAEAKTFLPSYADRLLIKTAGHGGLPTIHLYTCFHELLSWPEGKPLLAPLLQVAAKGEVTAQPQLATQVDLKAARMALKIPDQALAQEYLKDAEARIKNPPPPVLPPNRPGPPPSPMRAMPQPNLYLPSVEDVAALAGELIQAGLPDDATSLIPIMTDPAKSRTQSMPDNPTLVVAHVGEVALEANQTAAATLFAKAALQQLDRDWSNPQPIFAGVYFEVSITPEEVHRIGQLLLELGLKNDLGQLGALLQKPTSSGLQIDATTMSTDILRLQGLLHEPPVGLVPVVWRDTSAPAAGADFPVAWDMVVRFDPNSRAAESTRFSTSGVDLPSLNGRLNLQILAGPAPDNLRLVKTLPAANARGTTTVSLLPDDRYLSAIAQTAESQPHIYTDPAVPMSTEPNLFPEAAAMNRYSFSDYYSPSPQKAQDHPALVRAAVSIPGGPVTGGSFTRIEAGNVPLLELVGKPQPLNSGATYLVSGWKRGGGVGVRYLDQNGAKISDADAYSSGFSSEWQYSSQIIGKAQPGESRYASAPPNAVSFQPILSTGQNGEIDFCGIYAGVNEKAAAPPPGEGVTVMDGLQGAVAIVEAPQGGLLAAVFQNGDVRCFDLATHHELGKADRLPGAAFDVAFFNGGQSIVAADKTGNVLVRPVDGAPPGQIIYHAPWPINLLAAAEGGKTAAVADGEHGKVVVFNLETGAESCQFTIGAPPAVELIFSPDGKYIYVRSQAKIGEIWNAEGGDKPEVVQDPPPGSWFNELSVARFLHIAPVLKVNGARFPWWVEVESGFVAQADGSAVTYSQLGGPFKIHRFDTGPITAFCLSTQSNGTYTVGEDGTLKLWNLSPEIKLPPPGEAPNIVLAPPAKSPGTSPSARGATGSYSIRAPELLRGFPNTTLDQILEITVLDPSGAPAPNVELQIECSLEQAKFLPATGPKSTPKRKLVIKTGAEGRANVRVVLGPKPAKGLITISTPADKAPSATTQLDSIDVQGHLAKLRKNFTVTAQDGAMFLQWEDDPDSRTAFLIKRTVNGGPAKLIAVLPADATSYTDRDIEQGLNYSYNLVVTNDAEYGFPPKMPPPPDRLGNFLP